jgi:glutathione reductase (NADPH)
VFTLPPLAGTGLTEEAAAAAGLRFSVQKGDTSSWYSSRRVAETCSGYKIVTEEGSGALLGAHLLGPGAEEAINVFALAIRKGLRAADVKDVLYAYPTHGSDIRYMV